MTKVELTGGSTIVTTYTVNDCVRAFHSLQL